MKLKAKHDLTLPDGKTTIKAGKEFDYNGDLAPIAEVVEVLGTANDKTEAQKEPEKPKTAEKMSEEQIRARAKELKIPSYHLKGIDKLAEEIAEAEQKLSDKAVSAAEEKEGNEPKTKEEDGGDEPKTQDETPTPEAQKEPEGNANA